MLLMAFLPVAAALSPSGSRMATTVPSPGADSISRSSSAVTRSPSDLSP